MAHLERMNENGTRAHLNDNYRGGNAILGHTSHDIILPETGLANSADSGVVFLLPLHQDQDVHMVSEEDIPHSANDQWIGGKHIPLTFNRDQNHIPHPRSPGLYLPWRKECLITDACQASNEQGPSGLIDCKPSPGYRKALLIGITY